MKNMLSSGEHYGRRGDLQMSGPKHSQFEIEQRRQRELERERQRKIEEERRRREQEKQLSNKIDQQLAQLNRLKIKILKERDEQLKLAQENGVEDTFFTSQLEDESSRLLEEINGYLKNSDSQNLAVMQEYLTELQNLLKKIEAEWETCLKNSQSELQEIKQREVELEQRQSFLEQSGDLVVEEKQTYTIPTFKQHPVIEEKIDLTGAIQLAFEELQPYLESQDRTFYQEVKGLYDSIEDIYHHDQFDQKYKALQIEKRVKTFYASKKRYDQELQQIHRQREEYENVYIYYQSLCNLLQKDENPIYEKPAGGQLNQMKASLQEEINELNQLYTVQHESEYILQSVNEIMESLGYDILATDYMIRKKQNVHHNLYEFGEQAVNVFVSDNGSVLFEVSGISEGPKEMSSLEKLKVKEAMDAFCTDYDAIKEGLKHKGIFLNQESLNPPSEVYARSMDISKKKIVKQSNKNSEKNRSAQVKMKHLKS